MAYRPRRSPARRSTGARRSYGARRVSRARNSAGKRARSRPVGQQTLKIVVEQMPASPVARPDGPLQVAAAPPKKSKF